MRRATRFGLSMRLRASIQWSQLVRVAHTDRRRPKSGYGRRLSGFLNDRGSTPAFANARRGVTPNSVNTDRRERMGPTLAVPQALAASEAARNPDATAFGVVRSLPGLGPVIAPIWRSLRVDRSIPGAATCDRIAQGVIALAKMRPETPRPQRWYRVTIGEVNAMPDWQSRHTKKLLVLRAFASRRGSAIDIGCDAWMPMFSSKVVASRQASPGP